MLAGLVKRMQPVAARLGLARDWYLITLGAFIGTITAFGAVLFKGALDAVADRGIALHASLPFWTLPLVPMLGALGAALMVHLLAPEARGHGVPDVIDAVYRKGARLRPRAAIVKSLASISTIGSGGSAGAEGPIVQIGSAIGSGFAQLIRAPREHTTTLLGCGAAAGIASVFNAPIAGVFFVMEILLRDFSLRTFTPIVVASVFSTATTQAVLADENREAIFAVGETLTKYEFTYEELPSYAVLGLVCALVAVGFIRVLYAAEDIAERIRVHPIVKPIAGAFLLGVLGLGYIALLGALGHAAEVPDFFGNGYETIEHLLEPASYLGAGLETPGPGFGVMAASPQLWLLALLVILKSAGTASTLGSGGSGGVFAPSLFLGATAGGGFGIALDALGLVPAGGSPASYALVGMAAVVAGTTHAPLTAILILFELTNDYKVILPIMLAAVMATVVAQLLMRDSIYSLKLRRRGVHVGTTADHSLLRRLTVRDVQPIPHVAVRPAEPLSKLVSLRDAYKIVDFVVIDADGTYVGLVTAEDLRTALIERDAIPYLLVAELIRDDIPVVTPDEPLDSVLRKFSSLDVSSMALVESAETKRPVLGMLTRGRLMRRYQQALSEP